jgi:hypothetical protein
MQNHLENKSKINQKSPRGSATHQVDPGFEPFCENAIATDSRGHKYRIKVLRDSAALQSVIRPSAINPNNVKHLDEIRLVKGIENKTIIIQMIEMKIQHPKFNKVVKLGLLENIPDGVDMLLGNDITSSLLSQRENEELYNAVMTRSMTKDQDQTDIHQGTSLGLETIFEEDEPEDTDTNIPDTTQQQANVTTNTERLSLNMDRQQLIELQKTDRNICKLDNQTLTKPYPTNKNYYYKDDNLLMHSKYDKKRNITVQRIVVPTKLIPKVMNLAHENTISGHLGRNKMLHRIEQHFYWPKFYRTINNYVKSCDTCQKLAKTGSPSKATLQPLPLMQEPFKRIILDIVGPLNTCTSGNRFILTIMDMASHYPIAIPIPDHTSKTLCEKLQHVFADYGFPEEIQSDRGADFTSYLTKYFFNLFGIKHIKSSPMHPQSNGQIERFHRCLKQMIKAVEPNFPNAWDTSLPWILFAYRETPVETLGFTPFELIYTYPVRGPLSLIKESWLKQDIKANRPNIIQYLLDIREKAKESWKAVTEIATTERERSKIWYDKTARDREFKPGDLGPSVKDNNNKFKLDHLSQKEQRELMEVLNKYSDVFDDRPGRTTLVTHDIKLKPGTKPIKQNPYRANPVKMKQIKKEIDEMLELGIIEESQSSWASPIILVDKPDGTFRFVVDYRKVNNVSEIDAFPLPRIDDLIDRIGDAKYITKIDISKAYWQVNLTERSKEISAFTTPWGIYNFKVLPFGLASAPSTFQRLMERVLKRLEEFAGTYLDDITIYSHEWREHLNHIDKVLGRIQAAGLTIKMNKCEFATAVIEYLGHIVGEGQVKPKKRKIQAIIDFPRPKDRKQLRQFLGIANFYRKFIPHMAHIASTLNDLLKKGSKFTWTNKQEEAFLHIKSLLGADPILKAPDFKKDFSIACDASEVAVAAVLFQQHGDLMHPTCYYSKKLNQHQSKYSVIERECFGLLLAVRAFSVYFNGNPIKVLTDHNPLKYLKQMSNHNRKLLRWSLELQQFNLIIEHLPGKQNILPDILSRPAN